MMSLGCRNAVMWSLLGLIFLLALVLGPLPALAVGDWDDYDDGQNDAARYDTARNQPDAVLYEVTEDMILKDAAGVRVASPVLNGRRSAMAQLTGWAKVGTPLCPTWVTLINPALKQCTVNASGADDLSLANGMGTVGGTYAVVVQGDNSVDAPEYVILTGSFNGAADMSRAFAGVAPLGFITNGVGTVDQTGQQFAFTGTFRLPYSLDFGGKSHKARRSSSAFYLGDDGRPFAVKKNEKSIGFPTVRLEITF
jgi:hypothetical protein